jgi:hypothetical protein
MTIKGKGKGRYCSSTDTSPECLPDIFPCPVPAPSIAPTALPSEFPVSVPVLQVVRTPCPDGSLGPLDPNNCAVICPGNGTFFDGCRTPCPTDGSTSNDVANCEDACCPMSTTKYCVNFVCGEGYLLRENPQTRPGNDRATCCYRTGACAGAPNGTLCSLTDISSSLIPNPSFENHTGCPTSFSQLYLAETWVQATEGTSDYWIEAPTCDDQYWRNGIGGIGAMPRNATYGDAFVGSIKIREDYYEYYEYIGACLNGTIVAGVEYTFELDVTAALGNDMYGGDTNGVTELLCIPTCNLFPIPGYDYKGDEFEVIATAQPVGGLIGGGEWKTITFNFVPSSNCSAIMFGPGLNQTIQSNQTGSYVLYDFLNLQEGAAGVCNNNSECIPQP